MRSRRASRRRVAALMLWSVVALLAPRTSRAQRPAAVTDSVRPAAARDSTAPSAWEWLPTSGGRLTGAQLRALPIDDPRQALGLVPGVVLRGTEIGISVTPDVWIRGSGADETAVFVDGAPARFETMGISQLALGRDAISELAVVTGAQPASVADPRGAALSYVTQAGGPRFAGAVSAATDGIFSENTSPGFNRFDGFAGGPAPGLPRLTWFVSGGVYGQASNYLGAGADTVPTFRLAGLDTTVTYTANGTSYTAAIPRFAQVSGACDQLGGASGAAGGAIRSNFGFACQGERLLYDWSTSRRAQAKLLYPYGAGSSVSLTLLASDLQHRDNPGQNLVDNALYTGVRSASRLAVVTWTHNLAIPSDGDLQLDANFSLGADDYQSGPLDLATENATRDPALGIEISGLRFAGLNGLPLPPTDSIIRAIRSNTFRPPFLAQTRLAPEQTFRLNPYGLSSGWPTTGLSGRALVTSETRADGRVGADWRAASGIAVSAGLDFSRTNLWYYDGPIVTGLGWNVFVARPRRTGLYAQARLETGGVTLEAGVRGDRYVTGSEFPRVPGRIFTNPAVATGDTSYAARMARVMMPGRTQTFFLPRIRMGLAITPRSTAWIGVGQQVETPPFAILFSNVNSDLANNDNTMPIGTDVTYVTSTLVDGGIRIGVLSQSALELAAYMKTHVAPYAFEVRNVYDPFLGGDPSVPNENLNLLTATGGETVTGAEAALAWHETSWASGTLAYSIAHGDRTKTSQTVAATLVVAAPEGWRRGSTLGNALLGMRATLTARATSGLLYAMLLNTGTGTIGPNGPFDDIGTGELAGSPRRLPWQKALDLRISKTVRAGGTRWTAFADVRNLLDFHTLLQVFEETGTDQNAQFRAILVAPQITQLQGDAGPLWTTRQVTVNGVTQNLQGVDLSDCSLYPQGPGGTKGVVDCLALRQVEARWGNGDRFYDTNEINRALNAWYDMLYGTWRFHAPPRTARLGVEIDF